MAQITLAQIKSLLQPGLNSIFGDYPALPTQWGEIFDKNTSEKNSETDVEVKLLGLAQLKEDGEAVKYDGMGERYSYTYVHKGVALGFIMTRYAIRDNLYKTQFAPNSRALKFSFQQTKEIYGAAVLNNAKDSNFKGGDGKSLLATDHPIDRGTVANTPTTDVELSETALQDGLVAVRRFKNAAGLRVMTKVTKLIVPPELQFVAERLLRTPGRVGTTDNDINAIKSRGDLSTYVVNDFLTNLKAWYLRTNAPDSLKFFQRDPFGVEMYEDFDTMSLKTRGDERYSFGWSNFRGLYGSHPS